LKTSWVIIIKIMMIIITIISSCENYEVFKTFRVMENT